MAFVEIIVNSYAKVMVLEIYNCFHIPQGWVSNQKRQISINDIKLNIKSSGYSFFSIVFDGLRIKG